MLTKFRLSTLLSVTAIIALIVGWSLDRYRILEQNDDRIERLLVGQRRFIIAARDLELAEIYCNQPSGIDDAIQGQLTLNVWWLWKHRSEVNDFLGAEDRIGGSSEELARRILLALDCQSPAEYFEIVAKLKFSRHFPEFMDRESKEHTSFHLFVASVLD